MMMKIKMAIVTVNVDYFTIGRDRTGRLVVPKLFPIIFLNKELFSYRVTKIIDVALIGRM